MAKRVTQTKVQVEHQLDQKMRVTQAKVHVEELGPLRLRVTKTMVMVEYTVENWRHCSLPVQII